jgi:multidrug efflux pump subunit AcrA (membrane-fusion protein)
MYAKGVIAMQDRPAIVVPAVSVVIRDGHSYVFTIADGGDKVAQKQVTTGRYNGTDVEITGGLDAGINVVTDGAGFLNDADIVRVASRVGVAQ